MQTLIKNIRLVEKDNTTVPAELWLDGKILKAIGTNFSGDFEQVIDGKNAVVVPGFVDVHVI